MLPHWRDKRNSTNRLDFGARDGCATSISCCDSVDAATDQHVVSYSEEGILSREAIGEALAAGAGQKRYDFARDHEEIACKRFRSDQDRSELPDRWQAPVAVVRQASRGV